jgi:hypothetical protein
VSREDRYEVYSLLRGFIDESYDGGNPPKIFELSCVVTSDSGCVYFDLDWQALIETKNEELREQGRKEIRRFHAADFNSFRGDFDGWTPDEQKEFSRRVVKVFEDNPVHIHGWNMPLELLVQELPETRPNPLGFAYIVLLTHLMHQIGETTLSIYRDDVIGLHHDRCGYDAVLRQHFNSLVAEGSTFEYRNRFAYLRSEGWESCPWLQPADLIAYENFKEAMRPYTNRERRASLAALIDLDAVSGRSKGFTLDGIRKMRSIVDELGDDAKRILLAAANIVIRDEPQPLES